MEAALVTKLTGGARLRKKSEGAGGVESGGERADGTLEREGGGDEIGDLGEMEVRAAAGGEVVDESAVGAVHSTKGLVQEDEGREKVIGSLVVGAEVGGGGLLGVVGRS